MNQNEIKKKLSFWEMAGAGALAACLAEIYTLPIDTVKVRLQVQQDRYSGYISCYKTIIREEGFFSLWQGLIAGLLRQLSFATIRISIFDYAMQNIEQKRGKDSATIFDRLTWGLISGTIAISIANPFDVMKVRYQNAIRSNNTIKMSFARTFVDFYRKNGLIAFYQSLLPNILRSSITNAAELGSYSQCKAIFLRYNLMQEGYLMYFFSSFIAGFMAVLIASPFDVIKSRMMVGIIVNGEKILYKSIREAFVSLYKENGFLGFYAGFNANFQRLVGWNVSMFLMKEAFTREILRNKYAK